MSVATASLTNNVYQMEFIGTKGTVFKIGLSGVTQLGYFSAIEDNEEDAFMDRRAF